MLGHVVSEETHGVSSVFIPGKDHQYGVADNFIPVHTCYGNSNLLWHRLRWRQAHETSDLQHNALTQGDTIGMARAPKRFWFV